MTTEFDLTTMALAEPETVAPQDYIPPFVDNSEPVDAGTYAGHLIDGQFKTDAGTKTIRVGHVTSKKTGKNYLSVEFAAEIKDAKVAGKVIGTRRVYGRVNTMPEHLIFSEPKAGRENANALMDLLVACGWTSSLRSNDDYVNALLTLVEKQAEARFRLDWSAYSNPNSTDYAGTGESFRGMKNFPTNADGTYNPRIPDSSGNILLAKNEVRSCYPSKK